MFGLVCLLFSICSINNHKCAYIIRSKYELSSIFDLSVLYYRTEGLQDKQIIWQKLEVEHIFMPLLLVRTRGLQDTCLLENVSVKN